MTGDGSASPVLSSVENFARKLGEPSLQRAQSFKTTVLLGHNLVFKLPEPNRKLEGADSKEVRILQLLAERLDPVWRPMVPRVVAVHEVEGVGLVQAHTRLYGEHPRLMTDQLISDLGQFLRALHEVGNWDSLIEFEGDEGVSFRYYLSTASKKFVAKLESSVNAEDWQLVNEAAERVQAVAEHLSLDPVLVLVHKDLYLGNLLVDDSGNLSGVIDWAAAQTAPREWEFSILRQRMSRDWQAIAEVYGSRLDAQLIDICGLIQSLRFWKSFPHQSDFVEQQRNYIKGILSNV